MNQPHAQSPSPEPGDFILVHEGGQGGETIHVLQILYGAGFSDFEHVALFAGDGHVIEMASGGIQIANASKYANTPHRWSTGRIALTEANRAGIVGAARKYLAAKVGYSWPDYAAMAAHHFDAKEQALKDYVASSGHMICSQLVDQCYADAGVHLFTDGRWPGYVSPGDLNELLDRGWP